MRYFLATLLLCLLAFPAQAARHSTFHQYCQARFNDAGEASSHCWTRKEARHSARSFRGRHRVARTYGSYRRSVARVRDRGEIVAHPAGCPRVAFCGCGVAAHIFGSPIRALWLAAAWLRYPSAAPAPGMVAVRQHHVFAIVAVRSPGVVLAYDPNSGKHRTRIHLRSLAGFRVVNPHAG